jgi:hypothetical protein
MCLILNFPNHPKKIADKDIFCYKILRKRPEFSENYFETYYRFTHVELNQEYQSAKKNNLMKLRLDYIHMPIKKSVLKIALMILKPTLIGL